MSGAATVESEVSRLTQEVARLRRLTDTCVAHIEKDTLYQHLPPAVSRELTELREKVAYYEDLLHVDRETTS